MPDLNAYEVESLRRSVAMLPPQTVAGLDRETALRVLDQLERLLGERDRWSAPRRTGRISPET